MVSNGRHSHKEVIAGFEILNRLGKGVSGEAFNARVEGSSDRATHVLRQPGSDLSSDEKEKQSREIQCEAETLLEVSRKLKRWENDEFVIPAVPFPVVHQEMPGRGYVLIFDKAPGVPVGEVPVLPNRRVRMESTVLRILLGALQVLLAAEAAGRLYNNIKLEHIYWDADKRQLTVIDWANALTVEDGREKGRNFDIDYADLRKLVIQIVREDVADGANYLGKRETGYSETTTDLLQKFYTGRLSPQEAERGIAQVLRRHLQKTRNQISTKHRGRPIKFQLEFSFSEISKIIRAEGLGQARVPETATQYGGSLDKDIARIGDHLRYWEKQPKDGLNGMSLVYGLLLKNLRAAIDKLQNVNQSQDSAEQSLALLSGLLPTVEKIHDLSQKAASAWIRGDLTVTQQLLLEASELDPNRKWLVEARQKVSAADKWRININSLLGGQHSIVDSWRGMGAEFEAFLGEAEWLSGPQGLRERLERGWKPTVLPPLPRRHPPEQTALEVNASRKKSLPRLSDLAMARAPTTLPVDSRQQYSAQQGEALRKFHEHLRNGSTAPAAAFVNQLPDDLIPEARKLVEALAYVKKEDFASAERFLRENRSHKITEFEDHWLALAAMIGGKRVDPRHIAGYNLARYGINILDRFGDSIKMGMLDGLDVLIKCMREELQDEAKDLLTAFRELERRRKGAARNYYHKHAGSTSTLAPYWCALGALLGEPNTKWNDLKGYQFERYGISKLETLRLRRKIKRDGSRRELYSKIFSCVIVVLIFICVLVVGGRIWATNAINHNAQTQTAVTIKTIVQTQPALAIPQKIKTPSPSLSPTQRLSATVTLSPTSILPETLKPSRTPTPSPAEFASSSSTPPTPDNIQLLDMRSYDYINLYNQTNHLGFYTTDDSYHFAAEEFRLEDFSERIEVWAETRGMDNYSIASLEVCVTAITLGGEYLSGEGYFGLVFTTSERSSDSPEWRAFTIPISMYLNDVSGKLLLLMPDASRAQNEATLDFANPGIEPCYRFAPSRLLRLEYRADGVHLFLDGVESDQVVESSPHPMQVGLWAEPNGAEKIHVSITRFIVSVVSEP